MRRGRRHVSLGGERLGCGKVAARQLLQRPAQKHVDVQWRIAAQFVEQRGAELLVAELLLKASEVECRGHSFTRREPSAAVERRSCGIQITDPRCAAGAAGVPVQPPRQISVAKPGSEDASVVQQRRLRLLATSSAYFDSSLILGQRPGGRILLQQGSKLHGSGCVAWVSFARRFKQLLGMVRALAVSSRRIRMTKRATGHVSAVRHSVSGTLKVRHR